MRLGTRWPFGAEPPASVPAELRDRIRVAEAAHPDGTGRQWTLTWLEGRPTAELDDGTVVRDLAVDTHVDDGAVTDDDW